MLLDGDYSIWLYMQGVVRIAAVAYRPERPVSVPWRAFAGKPGGDDLPDPEELELSEITATINASVKSSRYGKVSPPKKVLPVREPSLVWVPPSAKPEIPEPEVPPPSKLSKKVGTYYGPW